MSQERVELLAPGEPCNGCSAVDLPLDDDGYCAVCVAQRDPLDA